jgi:integrase
MAKRGNGEGSIYPVRDKDGKVKGYRAAYVVYTANGVKRKYLSGKRREDVRDKLAKALSDRVDGLVFDAGTLTVGEYLERWLEDVQDTVRQSTHERYRQLVKLHVTSALGHIKLKQLTPAQVRWFYRERLDSGLAPATVHKLHVVLHKALKAAVEDGLISRNATSGLKLPMIAREEIDPLSPDETRRLLDAASGDRLEALYVVAIATGLRQGELLALRWEDVDLERGLLRVRRTLTRVKGKVSLGEPKTKKSRRSVNLTAAAVEALRSHLSRQLEEMERLGSLYRPGGLVFANEIGGIINPSNLRNRSFARLLKRANLSSATRFHDLRHTCATLLLSRNVNPKIVSEMLGHASIAITLDTYSHVLPTMQETAIRALEEALNGERWK